MSKPLLPDSMVDKVARRFKVLSEPVRLQLLNELHKNTELTVQQLVDSTGFRQANVSKHLSLMAREGILVRRKDGLNAFYSIEDESIRVLCLLVSDRIRDETKAEHAKLLNEMGEVAAA